jgi:hypothetical protein
VAVTVFTLYSRGLLMMKIALAATALAGAAALAALAPTAAHADTLRGTALSHGCMAFLSSTNIDGHDWVYFTTANPTTQTCEAWMLTYLPNGSSYSHDYVSMPARTNPSSGKYKDSGVQTAVCVGVPSITGSASCSAAY